MNIEVLMNYIKDFELEIIDSGFKRDIQDFVNTLPNIQNNIVALREVANKVNSTLDEIYKKDLPDELEVLFVKHKIRPFTESKHLDTLSEIINNTEIQQADFFNRLNQLLAQLNQQISQNLNRINEIKNFILPFYESSTKETSSRKKATISVIFKEISTISKLNELLKNITAWNRTLPIYHQILKSTSPEDIEIECVQNGSIDFVFNIDVDVAINLTKLFEIGFNVFLTYLSYKASIKFITSKYYGNQKLIDSEKEREKELLNNIRLAVSEEIKIQHESAKAIDSKIDSSYHKKQEMVCDLVTSHIVKGNDYRLISHQKEDDTENDESDDTEDIKNELRNVSSQARKAMNSLPDKEKTFLLEHFDKLDNIINEKTSK